MQFDPFGQKLFNKIKIKKILLNSFILFIWKQSLHQLAEVHCDTTLLLCGPKYQYISIKVNWPHRGGFISFILLDCISLSFSRVCLFVWIFSQWCVHLMLLLFSLLVKS